MEIRRGTQLIENGKNKKFLYIIISTAGFGGRRG